VLLRNTTLPYPDEQRQKLWQRYLIDSKSSVSTANAETNCAHAHDRVISLNNALASSKCFLSTPLKLSGFFRHKQTHHSKTIHKFLFSITNSWIFCIPQHLKTIIFVSILLTITIPVTLLVTMWRLRFDVILHNRITALLSNLQTITRTFFYSVCTTHPVQNKNKKIKKQKRSRRCFLFVQKHAWQRTFTYCV